MKKIVCLLVLLMSAFFYGQIKQEPVQVYESEGIQVESYNFDGLTSFLKQEDGTTYIINFWATWCAPCIKELPYFEEINALYKEKNVKVILVSLDFPKKVTSNLIPFIKRKKIASQVIHLNDPDANSWIEKVNKEWSGAIPATLIYKDDHSVFYEQSFTFETLEKELLKMLNQ